MAIWYTYYGRLVYFVVFGIYFPFWYVWTKINLATLGQACLIYAEETFLHIEIPAIDP
jgi:hypothetical protein